MSNRYFYRVENDRKVGPYVGSDGGWRLGTHTSENGRPAVWEEEPQWQEILQYHNLAITDCCFGFNSLRQLQSWFRPEELVRLCHSGWFKIVRIKGKAIIETNTQVLFVREDL